MLDVRGAQHEFTIECSADPLCLIILDRLGNKLRELPVGLIKKVEQKYDRFTIEFRKVQDVIQIGLRFFNKGEADLFADHIRLMYGIFVEEYGVVRDQHTMADQSAFQNDLGGAVIRSCPIHGAVPCNCAASTGGAIMPEDVTVSNEYPITIRGELEVNSVLTWEDLSAFGLEVAPVATEWRVSLVPGDDADFGSAVSMKSDLRLDEGTVGCKVRVQVARHASKGEGLSVSQAIKGPITLDSEGSREVLKLIAHPGSQFSVQLFPSHLHILFPEERETIVQNAKLAPFIVMVIEVQRDHFTFSSPDYFTSTKSYSIRSFYLTRLRPDQSPLGNGEATFLTINLVRPDGSKAEVRCSFDSWHDRNAVYHTFWFLRLSPSFKGFHRWAEDLDNNNFGVFQKRYSKLWASVGFYEEIENNTEYVDDIGLVDEELLTIEGRGKTSLPRKVGRTGRPEAEEYAGEHPDEQESESDSDEEGEEFVDEETDDIPVNFGFG